MTKEQIEDAFTYIQSDECREKTKKVALEQILSYMNAKYPDSIISMDLDKDLLNIEGDDSVKILEELKEIGLI